MDGGRRLARLDLVLEWEGVMLPRQSRGASDGEPLKAA